MYSLLIDTHFMNVVIVLYKDGIVLEKRVNSVEKHSTITMPMIDEILKANNLKINDIDEVICVNGPGSFTGVRIGVTISKMLGVTIGIKIKVLDYLNLMALFVNDSDKFVSIVDKNGAFVGHFNGLLEKIEDYKYLNKNDYSLFKEEHKVWENVDVDYNVVYDYCKNLDYVTPHLVNPIYVKNVVI